MYKAPIINGRKPDDIHVLDDDVQAQSLGIDPHSTLKRADEYDHYPGCMCAIIEYKSKSIRNAVDQLQETADQLTKANRDVDWAMVVTHKINRREREIFRKRNNLLWSKRTKKLVQIIVRNSVIPIRIYYHRDVDRDYKRYGGSLAPWVY